MRQLHNSELDLMVFDALPAASRAMLRESPLWISANKYFELLERVRVERSLLDFFRQIIPRKLSDHARRTYGNDHPQAHLDRK